MAQTKRMVQIGWIPDYTAWYIADGEEIDGWDLGVVGIEDADGSTTFTVNNGLTEHHYLPVYVEVDA